MSAETLSARCLSRHCRQQVTCFRWTHSSTLPCSSKDTAPENRLAVIHPVFLKGLAPASTQRERERERENSPESLDTASIKTKTKTNNARHNQM